METGPHLFQKEAGKRSGSVEKMDKSPTGRSPALEAYKLFPAKPNGREKGGVVGRGLSSPGG